MKYGVFIGRFMPFHNGHNSVVQKIIRDGLTPLIVLGGANTEDSRHPFNPIKRLELIRTLYTEKQVKVLMINDSECWDHWFDTLIKLLDFALFDTDDIIIYTHTKSEDNKTFTFRGVEYIDESYNLMFESSGMEVRYLDPYHDREGNTVSATKIRESEVYASTHLDARIFTELKKENFWN